MARLVGLLANRPDLAGRFAAVEGRPLECANATGGPWGWGLGVHRHGDVLLKRRPTEERRSLALSTMLGEVTSDLVVAHVRAPFEGSTRSEDAAPFRYRQWLFAETGLASLASAVRERMLRATPEFLRRGLRGESGGELLFQLFLAALHAEGWLDRPAVAPRDVARALGAAVAHTRRATIDSGQPDCHLDVLVAGPESLVAGRFGAPMAYRVLAGRAGLEALFADASPARLRMADVEACRLTVVASEFEGCASPPSWTPVEDGAIMAFTRTDEPLLVSLDG